MHKSLLNEFRLGLRVSIPEGTQVLVAEAEAEKRPNPDGSRQEVQVTVSVKDRGRAYLPGSSLKGVLRSRAEFIANTLKNGEGGTCHLFDWLETGKPLPERPSCGERFKLHLAEVGEKELPSPQYYKDACPACQLFGHTFLASRLRVTDFTDPEGGKTSPQQFVAIDRVSGGAAAGKTFTQEAVREALFEGQIILKNFSLWQLGWLGFLIQDLQEGLLKIGHKQTSGRGALKVDNQSVEFRTLSPTQVPDGQIWGVGALISALEREIYNFPANDKIELKEVSWKRPKGQVWKQWSLTKPEQLWQVTRPLASKYLTQFRFESEMQPDRLKAIWEARGRQEVSI